MRPVAQILSLCFGWLLLIVGWISLEQAAIASTVAVRPVVARQDDVNLDDVPLAFRRAMELALAGGGKSVSFDALKALVSQGSTEQEILQKLRSSSPRPRLTAEQIRELRALGASNAVMAWLENPPATFRLVELKVVRNYAFFGPHPEDKLLFDEKESIYQSIPETIEVAAHRSWYDERLVLRVEAPEVVEDGQTVRLRSSVRTDWDFRLQEPSTNLPFGIGTNFLYQQAAGKSKAGTPAEPIKSGNNYLEAESVVDVPVMAGDATFGGDQSHRKFYLRAESGVAGSQAMLELYFKYERVSDEEAMAQAQAAAMANAGADSNPTPNSNAASNRGSGNANSATGNTGNAKEPTGLILRAPHVKVARGSSVLIPVELINAKDVLNLDFMLSYKTDVATAHRTAEKGSLVTEIYQFNQEIPGEFKFNFAQLAPINGSGKVAGFRFDAIGPAASKTPLSLSVHKINDSKGRELPITTIDGSITIYDPNNLSDPNHPNFQSNAAAREPVQPTCSGATRQTVNDAQCCLKMWVGLTSRSMHMDLDQSGDVDSRDAIIVLRNVQESLLRTP